MSGDMTTKAEAGFSRAWAMLVEPGSVFTIREFSDRAGIHENTAADHIRACVKAGKLVKLSRKRGPFALFQASSREMRVLEHAKCADPYQNMWFVMRRFQTFRPVDLAQHGSAGKVSIATHEAEAYCWALFEAGYLKKAHFESNRAFVTYRLVKNTGPQAPRPEWRLATFDPNQKRVTYADGANIL